MSRLKKTAVDRPGLADAAIGADAGFVQALLAVHRHLDIPDLLGALLDAGMSWSDAGFGIGFGATEERRAFVPVAASTTHVAYSSIRMEPTWMGLGQAAGTAAHLALERKTQPRAAPVELLQQQLEADGQILKIENENETNSPLHDP